MKKIHLASNNSQPQTVYSAHAKAVIKRLAIARTQCFYLIDELERIGLLNVPLFSKDGDMLWGESPEQVIFDTVDDYFCGWSATQTPIDRDIKDFLDDCVARGDGLITKPNRLRSVNQKKYQYITRTYPVGGG